MSIFVKLIRNERYCAEFEKSDGSRFILSCSGYGWVSQAAGYDCEKQPGDLFVLYRSADRWATVRASTPLGPPTREDWVSMLKVFGYALPEKKEVFVGPEEVSEDIGYDREGHKYDLGNERYEFVLKDTIPVKPAFPLRNTHTVFKTPDGEWIMIWQSHTSQKRFRQASSYSALVFPDVTKGKVLKEVSLPGYLTTEEVLLSQGYHVVNAEAKEEDTPGEQAREVVKEEVPYGKGLVREALERAAKRIYEATENENLKALGLDPEKDKELIANLNEQIAKAPPGSTVLIITR